MNEPDSDREKTVRELAARLVFQIRNAWQPFRR